MANNWAILEKKRSRKKNIVRLTIDRDWSAEISNGLDEPFITITLWSNHKIVHQDVSTLAISSRLVRYQEFPWNFPQTFPANGEEEKWPNQKAVGQFEQLSGWILGRPRELQTPKGIANTNLCPVVTDDDRNQATPSSMGWSRASLFFSRQSPASVPKVDAISCWIIWWNGKVNEKESSVRVAFWGRWRIFPGRRKGATRKPTNRNTTTKDETGDRERKQQQKIPPGGPVIDRYRK